MMILACTGGADHLGARGRHAQGMQRLMKNDEFSIKNDGFCVINDEFCIKKASRADLQSTRTRFGIHGFALKMMDFVLKMNLVSFDFRVEISGNGNHLLYIVHHFEYKTHHF